MAKVSNQQGRGAGYAAHNDRSMYEEGEYDTSKDLHWDWTMESDEPQPWQPGGLSVRAEKEYYESRYSDLLDDRNARRRKQGHPEDVMSMEQWKEKNPPHETILQLGKLGDDTPDELKEAFAIEAAKMLRQSVREAGGEVISFDVHMREGSPHAHVRWIMNDEKGKPNTKGCLKAHGWAVEKQDRKRNPLQKWTAANREKLEALASTMGAELDLNRISRPNLTVQQYKAQKELEAALEAQEKAGNTRSRAEQAEAKIKDDYIRVKNALEQDIAIRKERVNKLKDEEESLKSRLKAMISAANEKFRKALAVLADKETPLVVKLSHLRDARNTIAEYQEATASPEGTTPVATRRNYSQSAHHEGPQF